MAGTVNKALVPVSTHSRAEAAAIVFYCHHTNLPVFQHTAARRRLLTLKDITPIHFLFQHTAARRRLPITALLNFFLN